MVARPIIAPARLACCLLLLTASPATAVGGIQDEVLAIDYAWTSGVASREPVDRLRSPVSARPLMLWVKITADSAALERLAKGGLPLRHVWMRVGPSGVSAEGEAEVVDEISLEVGRTETLLTRLRREVEQRGHFDWRTWSRKTNLGEGKWAVRLLYANGERVRCRSGGEIIDDCLITIKASTRGN